MLNIKKTKSFTYWKIIRLSRSNAHIRLFVDLAAYLFFSIFRRNKTFTFNKKKYKYFYHLYNRTVAGERIIEIPMAKKILIENKNKDILEVGNVMSHYIHTDYPILDKYEKGRNVINKDVVNFKLHKKFDLILSVSTMEHVGYSKRYWEPSKPEKFSKGIANLKKHLKTDGILFVTLPLFYNEYITNLILKKKDPFERRYFMKRTSYFNEWKQISFEDAMKGNSYEGHFANANILFIGEYRKK